MPLKIAAISPSRSHLEEIRAAVEADGHTAILVVGGKNRMADVARDDAPDLMFVDGMCCDPGELVQVEHVTTHHPGTAVILLCSTHTPDFLINSMRAGVREVLPSPAGAAALKAAMDRAAAKLAGTLPKRQGKVLAFMSSKGGSGATFLATNIGYQLAETRSVLLIDLNLQFGDALSFVHDGKAPATLADVSREIARLDASLLAASTVKVGANFSILAAPEDLSLAMEVKPEHVDAVLALACSMYDFVLVDMGRSLDVISVKALDAAHRIYVVLQAGLPHVRNANKILDMFRSLGYPPGKAEIVINRHDRTGEIGLEQVQRSLGNVKVHTVPNSYREVNSAINHGDPLARAARANPVARQLDEFAAALSPRQEGTRGLLGRLFRKA